MCWRFAHFALRCNTIGGLPQLAGDIRLAVLLLNAPAGVVLPVRGLNHSADSGAAVPVNSKVNGAGADW